MYTRRESIVLFHTVYKFQIVWTGFSDFIWALTPISVYVCLFFWQNSSVFVGNFKKDSSFLWKYALIDFFEDQVRFIHINLFSTCVDLLVCQQIYFFPKRKNLDSSKLKEFADDSCKLLWKWQKAIQTDRKHWEKRRNCSLWAISPFLAVFSKDLYCRHVKTRACLGNG